MCYGLACALTIARGGYGAGYLPPDRLKGRARTRYEQGVIDLELWVIRHQNGLRLEA